MIGFSSDQDEPSSSSSEQLKILTLSSALSRSGRYWSDPGLNIGFMP